MNTPDDLPPVALILDARQIPHRVFRHTQPVNSVEEAATQRSQRPEQVVRSIVFRLEQDEYLMVLITGGRQVSWKALRRYLGRSRLTMASEDEVLKVTGYHIGTVSPFGLPQAMRILVDQSVVDEVEISLGSGERGVAIMMKSKDLLNALNPVEVGEFAAE
ncbi:MAG TPA: YbaK/EbsC family protein [Anaerolineaceae bacterium]|nr:YbaK/EbsC family protein [Anaerolineaceae bacterium]